MSLLSTIEKDYIQAFKAKEKVKVAVLRLLKTAIKNAQVELQRELTDDEVIDLVVKQVKQRKESFEQYTKAGREDLASVEKEEIVVLDIYMPEAMSDDDLVVAIDAAIAEIGAAGMQDMGRVMQAVMAAHKGQVDGKKASALVRARLTS